MGQLCSGPLTEEQRRNREIERQMGHAKQADEHTIKLLLLGAGESGKSTLFKQMKLLYTDEKDFSPTERAGFQKVVYNNILADMQCLILATTTHTRLHSPKVQSIADEILKWRKNLILDPSKGKMMLQVWCDEGAKETWMNRGDIQVQDSLEYYMEHIDRIATPDYSPINDDILRTRVRTSGVVQETFKVESTKFEMYDVGGQRNERRKWINAFDGVTSVIFVAAISEYNQVLYEDSKTSRQDEAVELFRAQLQLDCFLETPFILFLNKTDLFRQKLGKVPFKVATGAHARNVDFEGPHCDINKDYSTDGTDTVFESCYTAACNYLQNLYENQSPEKRTQDIYTKFTNSTDTKNIEHIMTSCKDIIMRGNLALGGWLP